jgi:hypothetical protein
MVSGIRDHSGNVYRYVALRENEEPLFGKELQALSNQSPYKYIASNINLRNEHSLTNALEKLQSKCDENECIILSNEGWANPNTVNANTRHVFESFDMPIEIFMVTRPPVEWFNASWWQWGIWSNYSPEKWFTFTGEINYSTRMDQWRKIGNVVRNNVCDISQSPVFSFLSFLELDQRSNYVYRDNNTATNFTLLKHLINNKKKYGRSFHNPLVEFELNSILSLPEKKPPFIVPKELAQKIITGSLEKNITLLNEMSWADPPLTDETKAKYINEDFYKYAVEVDIAEVLTPSTEDQFIGQLIDHFLLDSSPSTRIRKKTLTSEDGDNLRDIALKIEKKNNLSIKDAYILMELAQRAKPFGPMIRQKVNEYIRKMPNLKSK